MANLKEEKVIGIPRAMSFYNNYPFYYGFFNDLGIMPFVSMVNQTVTVIQHHAFDGGGTDVQTDPHIITSNKMDRASAPKGKTRSMQMHSPGFLPR